MGGADADDPSPETSVKSCGDLRDLKKRDNVSTIHRGSTCELLNGSPLDEWRLDFSEWPKPKIIKNSVKAFIPLYKNNLIIFFKC